MSNREFTWKPKEGEELFRTLAETTSAAIFILEDLRVRYSNAAARIITGYELDELLSMDFRSLAAPAYREVLTARGITGSWASEIPMRYEMKLVRKDGLERWVDLTAGQTSFEGHPALVVTAFDISDRDEAEQALRHANQDLEKRVAERTAEILVERQRLLAVLQTQPAGVWIAAADGSLIEKNEMADRIWGGDAPMAESIADYEQYPGWKAETGERLAASDWAMARAVQHGETVIGDVVDIQRLDGSRATILNSAAPIFDTDGIQIGAVAVAQDITSQRRLEHQARQDARELDAIFESIHDAVIVYGADSTVERANAAAMQLYGFNPVRMSQQEITQRLAFTTLDGNPIPLEEVPSSRALRGEMVNGFALRVQNPAGQESWVEVSTAPLHNGSEMSGAVVVWHDISVREQLLEAHRRQKDLLLSIFQADPGGLAVLIGPDLVYQYANPAYLQMTGSPDEDPTGRRFYDLWMGEGADRQALILKTTFERGEPAQPGLVRYTHPDGSFRHYSFYAQPILWEGQAAVLSVLWDNTELEGTRDEAVRAAHEASHRMEETSAVINAMSDPVVIYDREGVARRANPAAKRSFGFDPVGRSRSSVNHQINLCTLSGEPVPEDDLPSSRALRGEPVDGERFTLTTGLGKTIVTLISAAPISLHDEVTGVVVVWRDITERERLLAQLSAEQAKLQAVIQYAPEAIIMIDTQANILLANPVARHLYGQAIPDRGGNLLQMGVRFMQLDGVPLADEQHPLLLSARDGITYTNIEMMIELPGGQQRMVLGSASPVLDAHGELSGSVAVFQDITQLKHSEEVSRREAARLELLAALSQSIAEAGLYYPAVLSTIAERVAESIGDGCIIRLVSDDGLWLDPVAFHHNDPEVFSIFRGVLHSTRKRVDEGYSGHVFKTGEPLIVLDMTQDELVNTDLGEKALEALQFPVQNGLIVPLRAQNRFIGTLIVFRSHTRVPFSSEDQVFLQDLADRAALAIDNARLYAAEAQRARELDALHKAASALLSTLDLDALLGQILDAAQNAIPAAEKGLLHLINPGTSELRVRAMLGYQNPRIQKINGSTAGLAGGHNFLLQAVRERRALLIRDTQSSDLSEAGEPLAVRSAVVAPLIVENKVLGVLSLSSSIPTAFNDADLRLLVSLAATTTAAIQNALLHSEVQRLAITDALTGLYNRRGFFDLGQREIDRSHRFGRTLSAIMLDIDHFKLVNDTYGHNVGDQVLSTLARRCRTNIRHVDILCRYGGEEFAILLPETDLFTASEIAERIRRSIADEPFTTDHDLVKVTISLGVTRALADTTDLQELLERADIALYRAKEGGRNRVEVA